MFQVRFLHSNQALLKAYLNICLLWGKGYFHFLLSMYKTMTFSNWSYSMIQQLNARLLNKIPKMQILECVKFFFMLSKIVTVCVTRVNPISCQCLSISKFSALRYYVNVEFKGHFFRFCKYFRKWSCFCPWRLHILSSSMWDEVVLNVSQCNM